MIVISVPTDKRWLEKAQSFATECYSTSKDAYNKRNQANSEACKNQHMLAKIAEVAVYKVFETSLPDFEIYQATQKSWKEDLNLGNFRLHVKSQTIKAAKAYGVSWVFQFGGKSGFQDALFSKADDYDIIIPVIIDNDYTAYVLGAVPFNEIKPLFKDPVLEKHRTEKYIIYYKDLITLPNLWCLQPVAQYRFQRLTFFN